MYRQLLTCGAHVGGTSMPQKNQSLNEVEVTDMWIHVGLQPQRKHAPEELNFE